MRSRKLLIMFLYILPLALQGQNLSVEVDANPGSLEQYAARELCRYINLLTGEFPQITTTLNSNGFMIGKRNNPGTGPQGYRIRKVKKEGFDCIEITAGDDAGVLYGVYGFLEEHMGISFGFDGEVLPAKKTIAEILVDIDETKTPAVAIRGFLPWTNFPQSATSYSWEDWKYILDQAARMRMNFLMIHNYSGEEGHNEMFHSFEADGKLSRVWNATAGTGHAWGSYPGWNVNKYPFGSSKLFDDYDFGADCALHNEKLDNKQVFRKGVNEFRRVIAYAHRRGIKIGLGLDINLIPDYYRLSPDDPKVIAARVKQVKTDYPDLDYLFCFQSESLGAEDAVKERAEWRKIFDGFYNGLKPSMPGLKFAVAGWGIRARDVATLPADVICAPISYYSDGCESGAVYGTREYWGCPWLERDFNSSVYYYPYNMHVSNTIKAWRERAPNMKGFYSLTWRITDAVKAKLWFMARAAWDTKNEFSSSEALYRKFAEQQYGAAAAKLVLPIINQDEAMGSDFSECRWTPPFAVGRTERRAKDQPVTEAVKEAKDQLDKANAQLKTIDSALAVTDNPGQRYRLSLLKSRLAAARDHLVLNMYASSRSHDINEMVRSWVSNFNTRVTDISSLGNVVSMQNRFVQKNWYDASVKQMNTYFALPPGNIQATGTIDGASISWQPAENYSYSNFDVFRDGKKINAAPLGPAARRFEDKIDGSHRYEVRSYLFGNEGAQPSVIVPCTAGNADSAAPQIIMISPPGSVLAGQPVWIKARLLDNRSDELLNAVLYYRTAGSAAWKKLEMTRKIKAIFTVVIPAGEISVNGIEYYVAASDGTNQSFFPADAPGYPLSVVQEKAETISLPAPKLSEEKQTLNWQAVNGASYYHIYRSAEKDFTAGPDNFVTYLSGDAALRFLDNGLDFSGKPLHSKFYYRVTAVSREGYESKASGAVTINYKR